MGRCLHEGTFGSDPRAPRLPAQQSIRIRNWRQKLHQELENRIRSIDSEHMYKPPQCGGHHNQDAIASRTFDAWSRLPQRPAIDTPATLSKDIFDWINGSYHSTSLPSFFRQPPPELLNALFKRQVSTWSQLHRLEQINPVQLDPQLYAGAFWTVSRDVIGLGSPAYLATKQPLQQKRDKIMQRYNVKVKGLVERCSQSTHELDNQQYAKLQHRRALRMSIKCGSPTAYDVVLRTTDSTRDMVYEIHDLLEMRHAAAREQLIDGLIAITHEILFSDFGLLKVFSPSFVEDLPDTVLEKIWTGSLSQKASVAELEARIASLKKIHGAIDRMRDDLMVETDKGPASNADSPLETPHLSSAFSHSSVSSPKI